METFVPIPCYGGQPCLPLEFGSRVNKKVFQLGFQLVPSFGDVALFEYGVGTFIELEW